MAAAARSFGMGIIVHILISRMANRSSQYVGGTAGNWLCMDGCSVADAVLVDPLRNSVSGLQERSRYIAQIDCSGFPAKPKGTYADWTPMSLNNDRISSPRSDAIAAKSDVCALYE